MEIRKISAHETYPLRGLVLRPNQPESACHFSDDELPGSFHLGAVVNSEIVGIVSFHPKSREEVSAHFAAMQPLAMYQLRGMATHPGMRGRGTGSALIERGHNEVSGLGGTLVWCNARTGAVPFYERHGYERLGMEFEVPGIGPHYLMYCRLTQR